MTNILQPSAPKSALTDDALYEILKASRSSTHLLRTIADAAVAAHVAQQVPDGWQIVPKEPTAEMQAAGTTACTFEATLLNRMFVTNRSYRAMLAAAPQEPK